ncbi:MAG: hypothetical protein MZV70_61145 [Desulfobacterales bacterium]|nr:hypothetical protein [Desulfobacterales bacterium]
MENELTAAGAIQIALLNNARLQARYEELGISQAELIQAGLLKNPTVFGSARFPANSPGATELRFELLPEFSQHSYAASTSENRIRSIRAS